MTRTDQQLSLFGGPDLNPERAVKAAMHRAAKASPLSREQIRDRMEELAREAGVKLCGGNSRQLSVETLEKWLNPQDTGHLPSLRALVVFCKAVQASGPLAALAAPLGLAVIDKEQQRLLRAAEIDAEIARLKREKRRLEG
jgi:hypothetical protein